MPPTVDFSRIREHAGSKDRGFEELCYQLLPAIYSLPKGAVVRRHGTPDGGTEAVATLPNGEVYGCQAKYLFALGNPELQQIDKSVRRVLDTQPNMTRYAICLPYNRPSGAKKGQTSAIVKWDNHVRKWNTWAKAKKRKIQFEYVGESELLNKLSSTDQAGRLLYWFDSTVLTPTWFGELLDRAIADAGERYTPELNVELPIAKNFDGLGRTQEFQIELRTALRPIRESRRYWMARKDLPAADPAIEKATAKCSALLDQIDALVLEIDIPSESVITFERLSKKASAAEGALYDLAQDLSAVADQDGETNTPNAETRRRWKETWRSAAYHVRKTSYAVEELRALVDSDAARLVNTPALLVHGLAGRGKTHLLCDVASDRLSRHQPTIFIHGTHLAVGEPWTEIVKTTQLQCTVDEFLGALQACAELNDSRAIIVIDAINEGPMAFAWQNYMAGFLQKLRRWPRLAVVVSCRTSYVDDLIPSSLDARKLIRIEHQGFAGHEYEAVRLFFNNFGLVQPDFPLLVPEFQTPLFLKLLCKGIRDLGLNTIPRGATGVTKIFDMFLDAVDKRLAQTCDYPPNQRKVHKACVALASDMTTKASESLTFTDAQATTEQIIKSSGWSNSLLNGMLAEGVLTQDRVPTPDGAARTDQVFFAYQRFGDHLRAISFCEKYANDIGKIGAACEELAPGAGFAAQRGLIEALSILIPENFKREFHELVSYKDSYTVRNAFLESLVWRTPDAFPTPLSLDYLNALSRSQMNDEVLNTLLSVACVPGHPLNAERIHATLSRLSMPNRDAWWSIYLHHNFDDGMPIARIIDWAWSDDTSYCADDAALLCATTLAWFFTSSNRFLRDRATKAMVSLLRTRPNVLVDLLRRFETVNDPYVAERLYAVAYGCTLILQDEAALASVADVVNEQVFGKGPPPVHVLLRDYARGTILRARAVGADLGNIDFTKVDPPYQSPWPLSAPSEAQLEKRFHQDAWLGIWASVMSHGDFHRYEIEPAVRDFVAPNQDARKRKAKRDALQRANDSWKKFIKALTRKQRRLVTSTDPQWDAILAALTSEQTAELARVVREFEFARSYDFTVTFDLSLASRWILNRVAKLGWTPSRFGNFDRMMNYNDAARGNHKAERIGKKYQWIALNELLARLADHCRMEARWSNAPDEYLGPWQLGLRDTDPSLQLATTQSRIWDSTPKSWWFTVEPAFPEPMTPDSRNAWLRDGSDIPEPAKLISVVDDTGAEWLALDGYYNWNQSIPPEEKRFDIDQCNLWYLLKSYLVKSSDLKKFSLWARKQDWMGRWMPEGPNVYSVFIGEYPWHSSSAETAVNWTTDASPESKAPPVPLLPTSADYMWEGNVRDCSLTDTVRGCVPSSEFHKLLDLSWTGKDFDYAAQSGEVVAFDPSARSPGASTFLVKSNYLRDFITANDYAIIFTVLGEKIVHGPSVQELDRLYVSGTYSFDGKSLKRVSLASVVNESWSKAVAAKRSPAKRPARRRVTKRKS